MEINNLKKGDTILVKCTVEAVFVESGMVMVTTRDCKEGFDAYTDEIVLQEKSDKSEQMSVTTTTEGSGVIYYPQVEGVTPEVINTEKQEVCEDVISRQATIVQLSHNKNGDDDCDVIIQKDIETVKALPPVNPQPKTGHWIRTPNGFKCSKCLIVHRCPSCGAKMVEPQESGKV